MSDSNFDKGIRLTQAAAVIAIPIILWWFIYHIPKLGEPPLLVSVEPAQFADPENDFAGLWELTQDCSIGGLTRHHGLGKYSIHRNLDGTFSLDVSIEFANGNNDIRTGWNTANLRYCVENGQTSPFCEPKERNIGSFHCNVLWPVKSDFLAGQATIDGHLHNIFLYLLHNPINGSTRPIITYDDAAFAEEHRGVLH